MTCWINKKTFGDMKSEGESKFPLETGGCLMGYVAENQDIIVTEIIGPGPDAKHQPYNFEGNYKYQADEVGRIYDESGRKITYLGDWHTHPNNSPRLSNLDIECLGSIANNPESRCPNPVMLVLGYDLNMFGVFNISEPQKSMDIKYF